MAIRSFFFPHSGVLSVFGDSLDNPITVSRDDAGAILINGGAVPILGGTATVTNTSLIRVFGQAGNDTITLDERNGALPPAQLFGGAGNDTLTSGSGGDFLFGQSGNDTLLGKGGNDLLFGGAGDDVLTGGTGNDQMFGQAGNDRMIWNPGDGSDLMEGGGGVDTAEVNGGNGAEDFTVTANGTRVQFDRTSPVPFRLDIGTTENLVVNMNGGDDTFSATGNLAALINITVDGGAGNDRILGGNGADRLLGGDGDDMLFGGAGDDVLTGGTGNDQMFGQAGNDRMIWNPGDGSDLMEGGDGVDTAEVNGGNGAEDFTVTANGTRVQFDRTSPVPFRLDIGTTENLVVNMNGGDDTFSATGNLAALINITVDGGAGNDRILGGNGDDFLLGGDGDDFIDGNQGHDTAFLGVGDDVFQWDPGDGSDTVEGGDGTDTMLFNGSSGAEKFEVSANSGQVRFTRDLGNIVMDLNDVERIDVNALGGTDVITVNDLSGTDVTEVNIDLGVNGAGDGAADTVIVNGTAGDDRINVASSGSSVVVNGLPARVTINGADGGNVNDSLVINGAAGADTITVGDLTGTGVSQVNIDLGVNGAGDGAVDTIVINTTNAITVTKNNNGVVTVSGLPEEVTISNFDRNDLIVINGTVTLLGQVMASSFVTAGSGDSGTPIADATPSQQQPLLAQPHA